MNQRRIQALQGLPNSAERLTIGRYIHSNSAYHFYFTLIMIIEAGAVFTKAPYYFSARCLFASPCMIFVLLSVLVTSRGSQVAKELIKPQIDVPKVTGALKCMATTNSIVARFVLLFAVLLSFAFFYCIFVFGYLKTVNIGTFVGYFLLGTLWGMPVALLTDHHRELNNAWKTLSAAQKARGPGGFASQPHTVSIEGGYVAASAQNVGGSNQMPVQGQGYNYGNSYGNAGFGYQQAQPVYAYQGGPQGGPQVAKQAPQNQYSEF